ncbi:uncharacterized protein LOC107272989 isoform X2 [Cephus cinctus]|uniref:Uncharacterized protein LOC107272989 isoform X2 n=1 Tax=Cephus cinctus TaxID=211228 RepID=A0AAJ7FSL4_CEPCN|nr:uncharacterized protein LOC107272989 isoform X2 [Cephus cinctus]
MKLLYVILWFMLLQCVLMATNEIVDPVCNCHPCQESETLAAQANQTADRSQSTLLDKEDSEGDGSLVICARDRDRGDRTFPNVCQMRCYNRCTKFGIVAVKKNNTKKYIAGAHRTNYYKLKDGPC